MSFKSETETQSVDHVDNFCANRVFSHLAGFVTVTCWQVFFLLHNPGRYIIPGCSHGLQTLADSVIILVYIEIRNSERKQAARHAQARARHLHPRTQILGRENSPLSFSRYFQQDVFRPQWMSEKTSQPSVRSDADSKHLVNTFKFRHHFWSRLRVTRLLQ